MGQSGIIERMNKQSKSYKLRNHTRFAVYFDKLHSVLAGCDGENRVFKRF